MSSPIHAGTLAPLLPTTDKTPCERVQPGVINWMQAITDGFAWWFKTNGTFSDEFIEMVQALECVGGGVVLPCPVVTLAGTATAGDGTLTLSFNGTRMTAGYDWELFRSTTEGVFSDPAITSGVTTGSIINYVDSGLVNDTEYFYKLTVQKPTCDEYEVQISGTPKECKDLFLTMSVVSDVPGHVVITVQGQQPLEDAYTYTLYASNIPNQIGLPVDSGTVVGHAAQINGRQALRLEQNPPLTGVPGGGQTWTYTLHIQEKPTCTEYELVSSVFVSDEALDTPVLSFSDLAFRWGLVNGAARYAIYVRAAGSCRNDVNFAFKTEVTGTSYGFDLTRFPCTENFDGTYCISKWEVKILAIGTNGISSNFSNVASTPDFIKVPGQCVG